MLGSLVTLTGGGGASAQPGDAGFTLAAPRATARLVAEHAALRAGETEYLALTFEMEPGWHMYWRSHNATGMGPKVTWTLPSGFAVGEGQWPTPRRQVLPGDILDHIYEDRLTIVFPVTVPKGAAGTTASLAASVRWMICSDECVLERQDVALSVPLEASAESSPGAGPTARARSADASLFDDARRDRARPWSESRGVVGVRATRSGGTVRAEFHAPGASGLEFIPDDACATPRDLVGQGGATGEKLGVEFAAAQAGATRIEGIVRVTHPSRAPASFRVELEVPVERGPSPETSGGR
ncbi:MAG: protein-disulfide reductase DsbD family protein [Planctomycetota bacterium]|nr:protein-disulfide reductase DsbD family protein [Planctomycetota bacterium]